MTDRQFVARCSKLWFPGLNRPYTQADEKYHLAFAGDVLTASSSHSPLLTLPAREAAAILRDFMLRWLLARGDAGIAINLKELAKDANRCLIGAWCVLGGGR